MILRVTFEEVTALNAAAERLLSPAGRGGVAAPPEVLAALDTQLPLTGDVSVDTLAAQEKMLDALDCVLDHLRRRMDAIILEQYVGSDDSVNAYFDYANVLTVRSRLAALGEEMAALIELMTGEPPADDTAGDIRFPD